MGNHFKICKHIGVKYIFSLKKNNVIKYNNEKHITDHSLDFTYHE